MSLDKLTKPTEGTIIEKKSDGSLKVGDDPIIPFIEGDGIGIVINNRRHVLLHLGRRRHGLNRLRFISRRLGHHWSRRLG